MFPKCSLDVRNIATLREHLANIHLIFHQTLHLIYFLPHHSPLKIYDLQGAMLLTMMMKDVLTLLSMTLSVSSRKIIQDTVDNLHSLEIKGSIPYQEAFPLLVQF